MTNTMKKENKTVITGKQMVQYLVLVALGLIVLISLSIAVIKISTVLFSISSVNAVALGGKIGLLVWLVFLGFITGKAVKKAKS
ncbi:MAG: hypothetical protein J5653_04485 [Clostridiales bacterium]|nr:hypothetical protein [Clostridiales bacterium]